MRGLEEDAQFHSGFVALIFLEYAGDDGSGKTLFRVHKVERLGGEAVCVGLLGGWIVCDCDLPAANGQHMRWNGDANVGRKAVQAVPAHREPTSGVEQVAGVIADVGEL